MVRIMKSIALVFMMLLLVSCSGAEEKAEKQEGEIQIYYLNKEETKIVKEPYILQGEDQQKQVEEILQKLAEPSETVTNKPPVMGFQVLNFHVEDNQIKLQVDEHYKALVPTTEVLTRAAIVRSLTQIPDISYVSMQVRDENLLDALGNPIGVMSADMFIDNAGDEINAYEKANLRLYFADESGTRLIEVIRPEIIYNSNLSMEKLAMEQLIKGPNNDQVYPVINPDTKIISVTVKDGICYVNLDESFLTQIYNVSSEVTIYSIANTLVELPNVNKVQISINGDSNVSYRESISLKNVFERNLEIVGGAE